MLLLITSVWCHQSFQCGKPGVDWVVCKQRPRCRKSCDTNYDNYFVIFTIVMRERRNVDSSVGSLVSQAARSIEQLCVPLLTNRSFHPLAITFYSTPWRSRSLTIWYVTHVRTFMMTVVSDFLGERLIFWLGYEHLCVLTQQHIIAYSNEGVQCVTIGLFTTC